MYTHIRTHNNTEYKYRKEGKMNIMHFYYFTFNELAVSASVHNAKSLRKSKVTSKKLKWYDMITDSKMFH